MSPYFYYEGSSFVHSSRILFEVVLQFAIFWPCTSETPETLKYIKQKQKENTRNNNQIKHFKAIQIPLNKSLIT